MSARAIVVDWGTSRFRAWLVEVESGRALDEIADGKGLLDLATPEFPAYAEDRLAAWRSGDDKPPVYMAGMVGSAQGWQVAPQLDLPIGIDDLAAATVPASGAEDAWIVPGCRRVDGDGVADLMRGEEVQIFGALAIAGLTDADFCLPGTHSKWARARGGRLVAFATSMTGEVYGALLDHTILGRPADRAAAFTHAAFAKGLEQAGRDGGLLHHLFTARSRHVHGDLRPGDIPAYLSGLLIGHETRAMARRADGDEVLLVCAETLRHPYETALASLGLRHVWVSAREASIAGVLEAVRRRGGY